jgi:hypothetical protein
LTLFSAGWKSVLGPLEKAFSARWKSVLGPLA